MPNFTTNLNLEKPLGTEYYDIEVHNENSDKIDAFSGTVVKINDIVDNLTTSSSTKPLSANMGKKLNDTKANGATQVIAGNGLTGGGDLTASRTLNVVSANDGIVVNADNIQLNTVDNLASTSATQPLSGNQGNVIKNRTDCMAGGEIKGYIEDGGSHLVGEVWLSKNTPGEFKCLIANSDNYPDLTPTAPKWLQIDDLTNASKLENFNSKLTLCNIPTLIGNGVNYLLDTPEKYIENFKYITFGFDDNGAGDTHAMEISIKVLQLGVVQTPFIGNSFANNIRYDGGTKTLTISRTYLGTNYIRFLELHN